MFKKILFLFFFSDYFNKKMCYTNALCMKRNDKPIDSDSLEKSQIDQNDSFEEIRAVLQGNLGGTAENFQLIEEDFNILREDINHLINENVNNENQNEEEKINSEPPFLDENLSNVEPIGTILIDNLKMFSDNDRPFGEAMSDFINIRRRNIINNWYNARRQLDVLHENVLEARRIIEDPANEPWLRSMFPFLVVGALVIGAAAFLWVKRNDIRTALHSMLENENSNQASTSNNNALSNNNEINPETTLIDTTTNAISDRNNRLMTNAMMFLSCSTFANLIIFLKTRR